METAVQPAAKPYAPGFDGRPIALVHLRTEGSDPPLAACSGEPFKKPPYGPSMLCPGCARSLGRD